MKFAVGDRVRLRKDMFRGELPAGSLGTVVRAYGAVSYAVKFDNRVKKVRVLERHLARA